MGDTHPDLLPTVRLETQLPNDYELDQLGIRNESTTAAPVNRGEFTSIERGAYEASYRTVVTAYETYDVLVTQRDLGAGEASRQTVEIDDGSDEGRIVDAGGAYNPQAEQSFAERWEPPPAPETEASTNLDGGWGGSHYGWGGGGYSETEEFVHYEELPQEVAPADNSYVTYWEPEPTYYEDPYQEPSGYDPNSGDIAPSGWQPEETDWWS